MFHTEKFSAVLDRLEENKGVLKFSDGQTLNVPLAVLPEGVGEGSVLDLEFMMEGKSKDDRHQQAKAILNDILKRD